MVQFIMKNLNSLFAGGGGGGGRVGGGLGGEVREELIF